MGAMLCLIGPLVLAEPDADKVVLTVSGLAETRSFTIADLQQLDVETFVTSTIWTDGPQVFSGVPLKMFVDHIGISQGTLMLQAINDYAITMPVEDAMIDGPIIAYLRNGEHMTVRDKGPLWLVYPYDASDAFQTEVVHARSIWQLNRIVLMAE